MTTTCPLPWIVSINNAPWLQQQTVYPRRVSISRLKTVAGPTDNAIGNVGYSGAEQGTGDEGELVLFTNRQASIQLKAGGRTTKSGELPSDAITKPVWEIFVPSTVISQYDIRDRDIITDDEGYRYEVGSNYWTQLGYQLSTIREEV